MKSKSTPERGLTVLSSYTIHTRRGEYKVIDIENGELVARREFRNAITSDVLMAFLGICAAHKFKTENGYTEKVYCTNASAYGWAKNKKINTKVSSPGMIKLALEKLKDLPVQGFTESVELWDSKWGNMRHCVDFVLMNKLAIGDLPF